MRQNCRISRSITGDRNTLKSETRNSDTSLACTIFGVLGGISPSRKFRNLIDVIARVALLWLDIWLLIYTFGQRVISVLEDPHARTSGYLKSSISL